MRVGLYCTEDLSALLDAQDIPFAGVDEAASARFRDDGREAFLYRVSEVILRGESVPAELLRLHLAGDARPGNVIRRCLEWQHSLAPYLTGVPGPADGEGFFRLGEDVLVCPLSPEGAADAMLPPGQWTDIVTGEVVSGRYRRLRSPNAMPIFAREGAVIPTGDPARLTYHWYQPPENVLGLMLPQPHRLILHRNGEETCLR